MRLDTARLGLARRIDAARDRPRPREEQARLHARREQESAEKLQQAAAARRRGMAERRMNKIAPPARAGER